MERKKVLDIAGFDIADNRMVFALSNVNGLLQMDIHTGKVEYLASSDRIRLEAGHLYSDIKIDDKKVWCIPYSADHIWIYHLTEKTCEYIEIPKMKGNGRETVKFNTAYDYEDQLILIPAEYPAILKINKRTYKINAILWEEKFLQANPDFYDRNELLHIARDFEVIGSVMYLLAENVMIRYEMDSDNLSFVRLDYDSRFYSGIVKYGNQFALVERLYAKVALWDEEEKCVEATEVNLGFQGLRLEDDGCPLGLCRVGEGFAVIQRNADFLVLVDEKAEEKIIKLNRKATDAFSDCYRQMGDWLVFAVDGQNQFLLINTKDLSQKCLEMDLNDLDVSAFRDKIGVTNEFVQENEVYYDLIDFIDSIEKHEKESVVKESCQVGYEIYRMLHKGV